MRARGAAQSSSAVGTMRVINSAQLSYAITCGFGFYSPDFQTLAKLPPGRWAQLSSAGARHRPVRQVRLHLQHGRNGGRGRAGDVQRPGGWNRGAQVVRRSQIRWTSPLHGVASLARTPTA